MRRISLPPPDVLSSKCPSRMILDHVTCTWGTLILIVLLEKTYRFSELRKRIGGISEKMLAQNLQALEQDGFVLREAYPVIPPKVEYSLTPMGQEVAKRVADLTFWIETHLPQVLSHRAEYSRNGSSPREEGPGTISTPGAQSIPHGHAKGGYSRHQSRDKTQD